MPVGASQSLAAARRNPGHSGSPAVWWSLPNMRRQGRPGGPVIADHVWTAARLPP